MTIVVEEWEQAEQLEWWADANAGMAAVASSTNIATIRIPRLEIMQSAYARALSAARTVSAAFACRPTGSMRVEFRIKTSSDVT